MSFRIKLNNDAVLVHDVKIALEKNDGYCPCKVVKNKDTKCMCREFRNQQTEGECHCGLYYKEKV